MAKKKEHHVVPASGGDWCVKKGGGGTPPKNGHVIDPHPSKDDVHAIDHNAGHIVHSKDGKTEVADSKKPDKKRSNRLPGDPTEPPDYPWDKK